MSGGWALRAACTDDVEHASETTRLLEEDCWATPHFSEHQERARTIGLPAPPLGTIPLTWKKPTATLVESPIPKLSQGFDLDDLRRRVAAKGKLQESNFVDNENTAGLMVLKSIISSTLQATAVLGSYFFIESGGRYITPRCREYAPIHRQHEDPVAWNDKAMLPEYACFATSYCFWTFPVICAFGVVVIFLKSLLDRRLFYECLMNKIFLLQSSTSFLRSPVCWFLFLYGTSGISCVYFVNFKGNKFSQNDVDCVFGMLAYLSATCAFVFIICSQWSATRSSLPLPTFIQKDCVAAISLLNECCFIDEADFRSAFEAAEALMEREATKFNKSLKRYNFYYSFDLDTAELMRLIRDAHEQGTDIEPGIFSGCWMWLRYHFRIFQSYWVTRLLYFPHLTDSRSGWFRLWCRLHYVFTTLAALLFVYTFFYLTNEFLEFQKAIDTVFHPTSPEEEIHRLVNETIRAGAEKMRHAIEKNLDVDGHFH